MTAVGVCRVSRSPPGERGAGLGAQGGPGLICGSALPASDCQPIRGQDPASSFYAGPRGMRSFLLTHRWAGHGAARGAGPRLPGGWGPLSVMDVPTREPWRVWLSRGCPPAPRSQSLPLLPFSVDGKLRDAASEMKGQTGEGRGAEVLWRDHPGVSPGSAVHAGGRLGGGGGPAQALGPPGPAQEDPWQESVPPQGPSGHARALTAFAALPAPGDLVSASFPRSPAFLSA